MSWWVGLARTEFLAAIAARTWRGGTAAFNDDRGFREHLLAHRSGRHFRNIGFEMRGRVELSRDPAADRQPLVPLTPSEAAHARGEDAGWSPDAVAHADDPVPSRARRCYRVHDPKWDRVRT